VVISSNTYNKPRWVGIIISLLKKGKLELHDFSEGMKGVMWWVVGKKGQEWEDIWNV